MLGLDKGVVTSGLLSNFRKLGEDEQNGNSDTKASNTEVDELDVGEVVSVLAREESLGSDKGTNEGSNTVPGLAELETRRGSLGVTNDNGVGVGSSLESSKTASDNQGASTCKMLVENSLLNQMSISYRNHRRKQRRVEEN